MSEQHDVDVMSELIEPTDTATSDERDDGRAVEDVAELEIDISAVLTEKDFFEFLKKLVASVERAACCGVKGEDALVVDANIADQSNERVADSKHPASATDGVVDATHQKNSASALTSLLPILQQCSRREIDETAALTAVVACVGADKSDVTMPILAAMISHQLLRQLATEQSAVGNATRNNMELLRSVMEATCLLRDAYGLSAFRILPQLARSVGRTAARRRVPIQLLPKALLRTAAELTTQPDTVKRLVQTSTSKAMPVRPAASRRLRINGPVEINIVAR